jgi:hypothetical protein
MSCEPSSLISAIHRNLPYFTNNPFEGVNFTNATITVDNILEDLLVEFNTTKIIVNAPIQFLFPFQRAGVWSGIIFAALLLFMIVTWVYCCCACVFCCVGERKPSILKVLLGIVTSAIIVVCM